MNTKNIIIFVLSLFWLYSCSYKDDKLRKTIVGTYYTVQNIEDENFLVSVDGYDTYSEDGTYLSIGKMSVLTTDEDLGSVNLKYTLSVMGKYRIENSKLLVDYDLNTFSIIYEGTDNVIIDFELVMYFQQFRKQLENIIISNLKEGMNKTDVYKIIELTSDKMVAVDSEGNKISSKRVEKVDINNLSFNKNLNKTENNNKENEKWEKYLHKYGYSIELPDFFEEGELTQSGIQYYTCTKSTQIELYVETIGEGTIESLKNDYEINLEQSIGCQYNAIKSNFYVISGTNQSNIYYKKAFIENNQTHYLSITYPASEQKYLDKYISRISKSFN